MTFPFAYCGVASGPGSIGLSGALSTSSGTSPVASSARNIVGAGTLRFQNLATDSGTPQYNFNSAGFTNITEGMELAVAHNDTLAVRATLPTTGQRATFQILGNGNYLENVALEKL